MKKIRNVTDLRVRKKELMLKQKDLEKEIRHKWAVLKGDILHPDNKARHEMNGNGYNGFEAVLQGALAVAGEAVARNLAHRVSNYFFGAKKN